MKETKYGMAMSLPHCLLPRLADSASQSRPPMHDSMICCQLSPVAHLPRGTQSVSKCVPVRLCIRSFCTQWQIPAEVDWLSGLHSAKNKD